MFVKNAMLGLLAILAVSAPLSASQDYYHGRVAVNTGYGSYSDYQPDYEYDSEGVYYQPEGSIYYGDYPSARYGWNTEAYSGSWGGYHDDYHHGDWDHHGGDWNHHEGDWNHHEGDHHGQHQHHEHHDGGHGHGRR